jgi:diguanylate cyclase (GGDEF)-like protein
VLFGVLCSAVGARAGDPPGRVPRRSYDSERGLTNLAVFDLQQDRDGFLWVATEDGIYRYDGNRFQRFGTDDGLPSNVITAFDVGPDGRVWAGTWEGLARGAGAPERFRAVDENDGLPRAEVRAVRAGSDGRAWVSLRSGFFVEEARDRFVAVAGWSGAGPAALWPRAGGAGETLAAVGSAVELWTRAGRREVLIDQARGRALFGGAVTDVVEDPWGRTIVVAERRVFVRGAGASFAVLPGRTSLSEDGTLTVDARGRIWTAVDGGVSPIEPPGQSPEQASEVLPTRTVRAVYEDSEGSVWLAGGTLERVVGRGLFRRHGEEDGLPHHNVWAITRQPRTGTLFAGTSRGLARGDEGRWRPVEGTEQMVVRSIVWDGDDAAYLAGTPPELVRVELPRDGGARARVTGRWGESAGLAGGRIQALARDPDGFLWVSTGKAGLFRFADGRFRREALPEGPPEERIADVVVDGAGRVLAAGEAGLAVRPRGGAWRRLTKKDGLLATHVSYVAVRRDGRVCVAYFEPLGISCLALDAEGRPKAIQHLDPAESGAERERVYLVGEDAAGRLWVGTGRGAHVYSAGGVHEHFTQSDGMPGDDCDARAFFAEPSGAVWLGTTSGIARFDGARYSGPPPPPAPAVLMATLGTRVVPFASATPVDVGHDASTLEVRFSGLSFVNEGKVRHEVRLVGFEPDWRANEVRLARWTALPPGHYRFEVRARLDRGAWGPTRGFEFRIRPPLWATWWGRLLAALVGALAIAQLVRWRLRALRQRNEELEALVAARTAELAAANQRLTELTVTDPLTGLRNRRWLDLALPQSVKQVERAWRDRNTGRRGRNIDLVFLMVDLDHFKQVNDTYGHAAGDRVLLQMRDILLSVCRSSDTAARWGGEEFLVIARDTDRAEARTLAERIRAAVRAHRFDVGDGVIVQKTCSIGFCAFPFVPDHFELGWEEVLKLADACLYAAKRGGRDCWVGLSATSDAPLSAEALRTRISELIAAGRVQVVTSLPDGTPLDFA